MPLYINYRHVKQKSSTNAKVWSASLQSPLSTSEYGVRSLSVALVLKIPPCQQDASKIAHALLSRSHTLPPSLLLRCTGGRAFLSAIPLHWNCDQSLVIYIWWPNCRCRARLPYSQSILGSMHCQWAWCKTISLRIEKRLAITWWCLMDCIVPSR